MRSLIVSPDLGHREIQVALNVIVAKRLPLANREENQRWCRTNGDPTSPRFPVKHSGYPCLPGCLCFRFDLLANLE